VKLPYNRLTTDVNPTLAENPLLRITDLPGVEANLAFSAGNWREHVRPSRSLFERQINGSLTVISTSPVFFRQTAAEHGLEDPRACQLYPPNRAARVERALRFYESRGFTTENPGMRIRRLFPKHMREQSLQTPEFDL
jgi:hypothetical protein